MAKQSYNQRQCEERGRYEKNLAVLRRQNESFEARKEAREFYRKLNQEEQEELKSTTEGSQLVKALSCSC